MKQPKIIMRVSLDGTVSGKIGEIEFEAKVYHEPSLYGINEGRVVRLLLRRLGMVVIHYDKQWVRPVTNQDHSLFLRVSEALNQLPTVAVLC